MSIRGYGWYACRAVVRRACASVGRERYMVIKRVLCTVGDLLVYGSTFSIDGFFVQLIFRRFLSIT